MYRFQFVKHNIVSEIFFYFSYVLGISDISCVSNRRLYGFKPHIKKIGKFVPCNRFCSILRDRIEFAVVLRFKLGKYFLSPLFKTAFPRSLPCRDPLGFVLAVLVLVADNDLVYTVFYLQTCFHKL